MGIALDLFCGAGGAALGLIRAGFDVVGFDVVEQPDYPGEFVLGDALELTPEYLSGFDFVWASPPCQAYSVASINMRKGKRVEHPDLILPTRALLAGHPRTCIENVPGAPLRPDAVLTLDMFRAAAPFPRKRIFETSFPVQVKEESDHRLDRLALINCTGNSSLPDVWKRRRRNGLRGTPTAEEYREAMGTPHIIHGGEAAARRRIAQCVPPEYAEFLARTAFEPNLFTRAIASAVDRLVENVEAMA